MHLKKVEVGFMLLAIGCLVWLFVLSGIAYAQEPVPSIDIEKHTNGQDADTPTGPYILVGDPVAWEYVITNDGNVDLTNVQVSDNVLGFICGISPLAVGESATCTVSGYTAAGQYANLATATGDYDGTTVSDEDPSHYFGFVPEPGLDIEKHTNGRDADTPPGPTIEAGGPVLWEYIVTNTGNVDLTNVTVTDSQGVAVSCPQSTLGPSESMTCTASGSAAQGQYANLGTARGEYDGREVSESDASHYYGVVEFVPEPGTIVLLGSGLMGLAGYAGLRLRKK